MTFSSATDFRKSLEARLKNLAQSTGQDLQRLRRKVAFDRLLARVFGKKEVPSFLLKGGYAMELRFNQARATKDLDLTYLERFDHLTNANIAEEVFHELQDIVQMNLKDYFVYQIGSAQLDLDNAPYGGARYPVTSFLDGRLFVRFQIDIGLDVAMNEIEKIQGQDWLTFCNIPSPLLCMISREQQFAEKIHAYTLPREGRINTRTKDLIDLILLLDRKNFDPEAGKKALQAVFRVRGTHFLPEKLPEPPKEWEKLFQKMTQECGIQHGLQEAYIIVNGFFQKILMATKPTLK